jgi:hypothetical protein
LSILGVYYDLHDEIRSKIKIVIKPLDKIRIRIQQQPGSGISKMLESGFEKLIVALKQTKKKNTNGGWRK